ncbi:hypothetical protein [Pedobacter jejuensis]|uniref:Uncharacterized protein n=1 Tax=Pedobacter jejuensis TaxID=1268550 RepID=A0A3N0BVG4_9SPHI|nr:hypothetical protein [Pedobacter jejuensis]RNL53401.1 hypothetical protein D7004_09985 [Pedobacter jejuensis]
MLIDNETPTSDLLEVKLNDFISDKFGNEGVVNKISINDSDEFWLFIFSLSNNKSIEITKIKNIC